MNTTITRGTDMNTQKTPRKMILFVTGVSFLLLAAFPQMLLASHRDQVVVKGLLGDLGLVLVDRSHRPHHKPSGRHHYRGKGRHGGHHPVSVTDYRHHRRPAFYGDYCNSGYNRPPSRRHRHPHPNHYDRNRHRHPWPDHYSWR